MPASPTIARVIFAPLIMAATVAAHRTTAPARVTARGAVLLRLAAVAMLACVALAASAQSTGSQQAIEKEMTAEQFKAAGLDKLSGGELANLNAWLNKTLVIETTKAATQATTAATKKVKDDNRGFFNFGSVEPIKSAITGEFRGFASGRRYVLANGQEWRQIDDASLAGVRLTAPEVTVTPSLVGNAWFMAIKGYNTRAKVMRDK